jgi:hypothetical protein
MWDTSAVSPRARHTCQSHLVGFILALSFCASSAWAQAPQVARQPPGRVTGTVVDDTGTAVAGAKVTLSQDLPPGRKRTSTDTDGRFTLTRASPGPFSLTVRSPGFADQTVTGVVVAGEITTLPPVRLTIAAGAVTVNVVPTEVVAERQIKAQEQQRVLGFVPNFLVSYDPHAAPLTTGQKFELSWKTHLDPVVFGFVAAIAGIEQQQHVYGGFGDGLPGYAKRYGATYATMWTRGLITQVVLPSVFRQDPRYFFDGSGSAASRFAYAVSRVVVRRGDDGRSQPNYSGILGSLAAGGISNLYYPEQDRRGLRLTFENTAIGLVGGAVNYLAQEFLFPKLTSHAHTARGSEHAPAAPGSDTAP